MPTDTGRANARTLPTAETDEDLEKAARLMEFSRACTRLLKARAQIEDPDSEDEQLVKRAFAEERSALRALFLLPAVNLETVWDKLEAFETELTKERIVGQSTESILMLALGSIKEDLLNLGIGRGA